MHEFGLLIRKDIFVLVNNIKLILKNPLRLFPYLFVVGYFSFFYFRRGRQSMDDSKEGFGDVQDLADQADSINFAFQNFLGIITLLALGFLVFQLFRATKKNTSFFTMADVNHLFPSPVSPANILLYYLLRSFVPALGGSIVFILYSTAQLNEAFDFHFGSLSLMILGLTFFFFLLSGIRFLVYTLHTRYGILAYIQNGVMVLAVLISLLIIIPGFLAEKFWQGMFLWISSPWFDVFPMVGWSRNLISYPGHENTLLSLGFVGVYALASFGVVKLVILHSGHYYEDVLEATQSNEETKEKAKGKREASESTMSLNKNKKLELKNFGTGASALYWRNYVHSSRQDFHPLIGVYGFGIAGIAIIMACLSFSGWLSHKWINGYLLTLLAFYFIAGITKTSVGDLKKPYFILIPAKWSAKFWNMIKLDMYQTLVFALVLIVPTVAIAQLSWGLVLFFPFCLLAFYISGFAISLTAQVGFEEGWDRKLVKPLIIGGVLVFGILPSLALGITAFVVSGQFVYAMLGTSIGMALVAAVLLHLSLDIISRVELKEAN
ncbi:putative ABC exporter domain-containing protein [Cyclobacterium plantarum]|uniref:putative ABC exporter domain-containing protein n=1 Tax=Cyclobacterium plantarum TaxID=2716263 RepID=UPI003F70CD38